MVSLKSWLFKICSISNIISWLMIVVIGYKGVLIRWFEGVAMGNQCVLISCFIVVVIGNQCVLISWFTPKTIVHFFKILLKYAYLTSGQLLNNQIYPVDRNCPLDGWFIQWIHRFSFSCPWVMIFLHSRELN